MAKTVTSTLTKWGNSQGVRIPKEICALVGARPGDAVTMVVDETRSQLTLSFNTAKPRYRRRRRVSLEELCEDWDSRRVGEEWPGPDVGAEVVE